MLTAQQIGQNLQQIRKSLRPRANATNFYKSYLKNIPGVPEQGTDAAAAKFMSQIENGERQLPACAYAIYADLGGVSIDWILSGHEYHPVGHCLDYSDALRCLAVLEASGAVQIDQERLALNVTDYALQGLLRAFQQAKSDAVALGSPDRIDYWMSYVLDTVQGCRLDPDKAKEVQDFHTWLLQSYSAQIRAGQKSDFALLLEALQHVAK